MPIRVKSTRPSSVQARSTRLSDAEPPFGLPVPPADWPQAPAGVSLCMIVKNEERFLEQCLRSVADVVDEINVVDTGSTDRTVEIARQFGANLEHCEWRNDFGWARNKSLEMATKRWILQLDADEELLPESRTALEQLKTAPAYLEGVWLRCINATDRYRGGGNMSHAILRMFPNNPRIRFKGAIHEFPSIDDSPVSMTGVMSPVKILHHGYLAEVVKDRDKYGRNLAIIEQNIAAEPDEAFHWYNLGMTTHLGGDNQRAAPALERMWDLCLKNGMRAFTANGLQTLCDVYSEHLGQPEKGLPYALECIERSPRYANAHFSAGKAYFLLKRYDEAREMYAKAIEDGRYVDRQYVVDDEVPQWKAQCEIGSTYAEQGEHAKAAQWFERGLANRPMVQPLRLNYANALEALGRLSEAENLFRSIYADFGDEQSIVCLVNYFLRRQHERDAVDLIERHYAQVSPNAAVSMLLAATVVVQRSNWGDGERYLLEAQRIAPDSAEVRAALEALYRNRETSGIFERVQSAFAAARFDEAIEQANAGMAEFPGDARFPYYAALACANVERKTEALAYLSGLQDPSAGEGPHLLNATLLREFGRNAEALAALERVLVHNASNVDALLMKSSLLEVLGRSAEAEQVLQSALPAGKQRAAVELAGLYLRQGRLEDAKRIAQEALP